MVLIQHQSLHHTKGPKLLLPVPWNLQLVNGQLAKCNLTDLLVPIRLGWLVMLTDPQNPKVCHPN